ncbi:hypothetical protein D7006_14625 [Xanthobacter sp. YC-JY1]|nr:hypothetical protein D7006_14625 [Xanthobacter sp. YC-JY1]
MLEQRFPLLAVVMPGLVPGIHVGPQVRCLVGCSRPNHVDGRDKPGHDVWCGRPPPVMPPLTSSPA